MNKHTERIENIKNGDIRTVSRVIRNIEDDQPEAREIIKRLYPNTGKARVIGLTGAPGSGKSTLTDALIKSYRNQGKSLGVLLLDPSSPFSGGAILGDRIRMQQHSEDSNVFIRSLASRGALGGLSAAAHDAVQVLDAMGKDIILIETVGIGQSEIDIMYSSHSVVLVLTPGLGDEVQTIKSGIMEIADIFVINKADRQGAEKLSLELLNLVKMITSESSLWQTPIVRIENIADSQAFLAKIDELGQVIDDHYNYLSSSNNLPDRVRRKAEHHLLHAFRTDLLNPLLTELKDSGQWEDMVSELLNKRSDPHSLVQTFKEKIFKALRD